MLRILYINHSPKLSGAERVLIDFLTYADRTEIYPVVVCREGSALVSYFKDRNILTETARMPWFTRKAGPKEIVSYVYRLLTFNFFILARLRRYKIDLIHAHTFIAALYAALPARLSGRPLVWHMHDILEVNSFNRAFIRFAGWGSARIICVSGAVKKNLVDFGVSPEKCEVIYNAKFKDDSDARGDFRGEFKIPKGSPLVAVLGQIREGKGQISLIRAVPLVLDAFPSAVFAIVGDIVIDSEKRYLDELKKAVSDLGLGRNVIFTGFRKDAASILNGIDILVHTATDPDPAPLVLAEAMDKGKPVIATRVGGVPELVSDGVSGFLVPPGDSVALAESIIRLIGDPALRSEMGRAGKKMVAERFRPEDNYKKIRTLYYELKRGHDKI